VPTCEYGITTTHHRSVQCRAHGPSARRHVVIKQSRVFAGELACHALTACHHHMQARAHLCVQAAGSSPLIIIYTHLQRRRCWEVGLAAMGAASGTRSITRVGWCELVDASMPLTLVRCGWSTAHAIATSSSVRPSGDTSALQRLVSVEQRVGGATGRTSQLHAPAGITQTRHAACCTMPHAGCTQAVRRGTALTA
jgi:hypothetical protein